MLKKKVATIIGILGVLSLLATTAGCGAASSNSSSSSTKGVKLGLLVPETGVAAGIGADMEAGFKLYLKEHNNTLGGRPVTLYVEDTASLPATTVTKAKKLVEEDGVNLIYGPLMANDSYAIAPYLESKHVVDFLGVPSGDELTQRDKNDYMLRTGWTSSQPMFPLGEYAYKTLGYRKIATIGMDYQFGYESVGGFQYAFEKMGGTIVKKIWTPVGTKDYGPYLAQIPKGIDAVYEEEAGADAINFMNGVVNYGLKLPILASGACTDESLLPKFPKQAPVIGTISALHYSGALQTPENQKFQAAFKAATGRNASYYGESGYTGAAIIDSLIKTLGDQYTDSSKYAAAFRSLKNVSTPRGPISIDAYNNPIENIYIRKVEEVNGQLQNTVLQTIPQVSQFWTYGAQAVLAREPFSRTYPPVTGAK